MSRYTTASESFEDFEIDTYSFPSSEESDDTPPPPKSKPKSKKSYRPAPSSRHTHRVNPYTGRWIKLGSRTDLEATRREYDICRPTKQSRQPKPSSQTPRQRAPTPLPPSPSPPPSPPPSPVPEPVNKAPSIWDKYNF